MRAPRGMSQTGVTVMILAIVVGMLLFFRQVLVYYRQIKSGDVGGPVLPPLFSTAGGEGSGAPEIADVDAEDDPSLGPADAKLTIVEFIDYECPYSKEASGTVRELAAKYGDRVRFVMRDFPIQQIHPYAAVAAEAAGCAEAQGKYWPMHDRLFALDGALARTDLDAAAQQIGLDAAKFKACMDTHERWPEIQQDLTDAAAAGVRGTPTFFLNGRRAEGVIPSRTFERIIDALLVSP